MNRDQIYQLLWNKLGYLKAKLSVEEEVELDWKLTEAAAMLERKYLEQIALLGLDNRLKES